MRVYEDRVFCKYCVTEPMAVYEDDVRVMFSICVAEFVFMCCPA